MTELACADSLHIRRLEKQRRVEMLRILKETGRRIACPPIRMGWMPKRSLGANRHSKDQWYLYKNVPVNDAVAAGAAAAPTATEYMHV